MTREEAHQEWHGGAASSASSVAKRPRASAALSTAASGVKGKFDKPRVLTRCVSAGATTSSVRRNLTKAMEDADEGAETRHPPQGLQHGAQGLR